MKALVGLVILTVAALFITFFYRVGAYKDAVIEEGMRGPFKTVSKPHLGAYHQIMPVLVEVETWAKKSGEPCKITYGEFIDNPEVTEEDRLRSNAGCVVEKTYESGLPEGFVYREIPERRYIVATFDGAPSIGPMKVYPKAYEEIEKRKLTLDGAVIEMYEILSDTQVKTTYLFPVK